MSLCRTPLVCMYSRPATTQAIRNLASFSVKLFTSPHVIAEVTSFNQIGDNIQVTFVLERIMHVYDKRMLKLCQQLTFIKYWWNWVLFDNLGLAHFFECEHFLGSFPLYFPHFSESSFTYHVFEFEIANADVSYGWRIASEVATSHLIFVYKIL